MMLSEKKNEMDATKKKDKERVQLDFSAEALNRLDMLKEEIGASTRAETIRQALRLYDWFISETEPDSTIQIKNANGEITSYFKASLLHNAARNS
jgi:hypothetical protein